MTTREFFELIDKDADLAAKFKVAKDRTEVYKLAKEKGVTDDENTFVAEVKKYLAKVSNVSEKDIEGIVAAGISQGLEPGIATGTMRMSAASSAIR